MYKTCNVVILTTKEEANVGDFIISQYVKDRTLHCGIKVWESEIEEINQHLYITSDEEIKEGDWCFNSYDNQIWKYKPSPCPLPYWGNKDTLTKIIATTRNSLKLPNIPQQFIEKYIEEYNKGNVITKIEVEYEAMDISTMTSDVKTYPNLNIETLKLNPDNTINIKPIKNSWNREEIVEFFKILTVRGCFRGTESKSGRNYNIAVQSFKEQFNLDYEQEVDKL